MHNSDPTPQEVENRNIHSVANHPSLVAKEKVLF
jgi:hypothetical protein